MLFPMGCLVGFYCLPDGYSYMQSRLGPRKARICMNFGDGGLPTPGYGDEVVKLPGCNLKFQGA